MKTLLVILIILFSKISYSNDYFNALELFNKRKITESVELFKNVAKDEKNPKRSDAMYNLAHMYYSGIGTVKNLKLAYKMFLNAKISGINESNYFIDKITKEITPQELLVLTDEFSSLIEEKIPLPVALEDDNKND